MTNLDQIRSDLTACRLCQDRFSATQTAHSPRPVIWFKSGARILIAGQAPGLRVHKSGIPFDDPSGDRLRDWLGLDHATFYDQSKLAIVPMAFCFPGYDEKKADLPPPARCRQTWHDQVFDALGDVRLRIIIGGYAHRYHLGAKTGVTDTVRGWRDHLPHALPLPHPSWRNTGWLKRNPWFQEELLPVLQSKVQEALK